MPLTVDNFFVPSTGLSTIDTDNVEVETLTIGNSLIIGGIAQFTNFNKGIVQSSSTGILNSSFTITGNGSGSLDINTFTKANIACNIELPNLIASKPLKLDSNKIILSGNINQDDVNGLPETLANITSGNLGVYVLKTGDTMTGNLIMGNQSYPKSITAWGTIKQIDPTNSSQYIELDATTDTLFFSNINAKLKGSGTSLQTENITSLEVIGGSFAVKDNNTPSNFGGYIQITPNVANRTKLYHSGDRGLDIDGQTNNHQLRMTGFGNITMDNQTIFNQNATFKQSQFTEGLITIQPPGSGNIQQLSSTSITYSGSANTRIDGDVSNLKAYRIGSQYPFSKVQSYQPLEVDTINAVGNTLYIANDNSTDEIQIGVGSNVHVVNILTGGGDERDTLNIGSGNTQINFFGNTFYNYVTDHRVVDREIILNANAVGNGTSGLCGLWIRDNNFDAYNYFVVNSDRDGFLFRGGADPAFSNSHAVNLKCVNISGSSGKFLTCVDSTNTTNLQSGNIVKADLPASVAFLDNDQTFTGNQTYNCPTLTCNPLTELFINQISSTSSTFNVAFNSNVASASGKKFIQSTVPTSGNDLTNKTYCDNKVLKSGDTMTGSLNINASNPLIINTDNAILLPRRQTGSNPQFITFQNSDGSASYGVVESAGSAGSSAFGTTGSYDFNIGSYTLGGDVNIFQQGTIGGIKMKIGFGNTRSYNPIDMLNNKITGLATPTNSTDATTKTYVDNLVSGNVSALLSSVNIWTANNTFNGSFLRVGTSSKLVVDNMESSNPANLNIQFNSNAAFINNRIVQIDPLAETGLVIFGGNIAPAGANPTTISGQNSFSISQVPSGPSNAGVYLQTWNSRVLYLNSLGGNDITVGSQGGSTVNLNCWNNIRAYNKSNGSQYIQTYINTSDSNRGYLESVGTNMTIAGSPTYTYNLRISNFTDTTFQGTSSRNVNVYPSSLGSSSNIYGNTSYHNLNVGWNDFGSFIQSYGGKLLINAGEGDGITIGSQTTTAQNMSIYANTTYYQSNNTSTNINIDMPNTRFLIGDHNWAITGQVNRKLEIAGFSTTNFQSNVNIFQNASGGTNSSCLIWNGLVDATGANPSGYASANSFTISGDASFAYLQSWNSRPLRINQLGNGVAFFSPGAPSALSQYGTFTIYSPANNNSYFQLGFQVAYAGANNYTIDGQGQGYSFNFQGFANYFVGAAWQVPSDRRRKKNIIPVNEENAIEIIKNLNPVHYEYTSKNSREYIGFVAQEVEEILPKAVATMENEEQSKALDYNSIFALQTKVIQNLLKRVDYLEDLLKKHNIV